MTVIKRKGLYRLVCDDDVLYPWSVEYLSGNCWYQASKSYFNRGWAEKFFEAVKDNPNYVSNLKR